MRPTAIAFVVMAAASTGLEAQETSARGEVRHKSGFYERGVDFWKTGKERTSKPRVKTDRSVGSSSPTAQDVRRSIWAEPVKMADGRYSIYLPPPAVLQFLEDPTSESLEGYVAWKKERASKLKKAMRLLQEYNARESKARAQEPANSHTHSSVCGRTVVASRGDNVHDRPSPLANPSPKRLPHTSSLAGKPYSPGRVVATKQHRRDHPTVSPAVKVGAGEGPTIQITYFHQAG